MVSNTLQSKESVNLGPPLPHELPKPPFRPGTIGRIAFFFSIVAGSLVCIINLRRMGHAEKAKKVLWITIASAVGVASFLLLLPDAIGRLAGLLLEVAWYFVFPKIQAKEFEQWQALHPEILPASGWRAIGWGFLGAGMFFVIIVLVAAVLQAAGIVPM
jgi:hypothetical protein